LRAELPDNPQTQAAAGKASDGLEALSSSVSSTGRCPKPDAETAGTIVNGGGARRLHDIAEMLTRKKGRLDEGRPFVLSGTAVPG